MAGGTTLHELLQYRRHIGGTTDWMVDPSVAVCVKVLDVGNFFGHIRCLIQPLTGTGEKWVDVKFLTLEQCGHEKVKLEMSL